MNKKERSYIDGVHFYGRVWVVLTIILIFGVPLFMSIYYGAWPESGPLLKGLIGIIPLFWTVGIIEVLTYVPMLGTGGSYLGFITGNLANLKVPCALNAMEMSGAKPGSEESEVISTIAIGVSAIVTTLIIAVGVLLLTPLRPFFESELMQPAFSNILPALFGALAAVYISKNWKISIAPVALMVTLFILVPSLASSVGVLVPVGAAAAILVSRILYKKNLL